MTLTTTLYCVLALTLYLMQPYGSIDKDVPFSVVFLARGMDSAITARTDGRCNREYKVLYDGC